MTHRILIIYLILQIDDKKKNNKQVEELTHESVKK